MAPHELHTSEVVSEQNGTIIDRCKNVVSTISQKGNHRSAESVKLISNIAITEAIEEGLQSNRT